jgi:hypothetical protein
MFGSTTGSNPVDCVEKRLDTGSCHVRYLLFGISTTGQFINLYASVRRRVDAMCYRLANMFMTCQASQGQQVRILFGYGRRYRSRTCCIRTATSRKPVIPAFPQVHDLSSIIFQEDPITAIFFSFFYINKFVLFYLSLNSYILRCTC